MLRIKKVVARVCEDGEMLIKESKVSTMWDDQVLEISCPAQGP
jgi:hypothetical protein